MKSIRHLTLWIVAIWFVSALAVYAGDRKSGTVTGCLTDASNGAPITDAWVATLETNQGARTDSTGCFSIENLPPGEYNLIVTHAAYGTVQGLADLVVRVKAGSTSSVATTLTVRRQEETRPERPTTTLLDALGLVRNEREASKSEGDRDHSSSRGSTSSDIVRVDPGDYRPSIQPREKRGGDMGQVPGYRPAPDDYSWPPRDMFFQDYGTNDFVDTRRDRFSTFAVDVDDASYSIVRQYLMDGNQPPRDAVRVEEFINHFDYGYNVPRDERFRVFSEITGSPFDAAKQIMKIGVKGREIDRRERKPLNLTLVIDVSGSMGRGNRFQLVRESVRTLVRQLNGHDRVGIVAYGSSAYVVMEPLAADRQRDIFNHLNRLQPGGSTYAEAGIRLGYEMANRQFVNGHNNVVVLCSDGVANVGRTSPEAIMNEVGRFARRGISLNAYGYGMGNYNDVLLEQLAQKGDGRYAYINDQSEVRQVFVEGFVGNMQLLARDVKIQVEFDPDRVSAYRLLGYENRAVADHRFRDNRQDGGEVGAGHEVTALYELVLNKRHKGGNLATVFVRWKDVDAGEIRELAREVKFDKRRPTLDQARPELRLAVVAGRLAEMLKGTRHASETSWSELYRLAEPLAQDLPGQETEELLDLIRRAGGICNWHTGEDDDRDDYFGNYKR